MPLGTWITSQLVFDGIVSGLVIGLLAMGIVLIYRATRVINFAVGNMGLVGAALLVLMVVNWGVPFWLAAIAALAVGVLYGVIVELVVVRRLFYAPRVVMLVATIGIAGLSQAIITAYPKLDDEGAAFPVASSKTWDDVFGLRVTAAQVAIIVAVPIVVIVLGWALNHTLLGRTVKASAENPDLARTQGVNPKMVSTAVWAIAGFLATLTMILIGGLVGTATQLPNLGANTLARALVAAVIAGMVSFPRAMVAGIVIGVAQSLILFNYLDKPGLIDALLFVAVLIAVAFQSRGRARDETQTFSFTPKVREIPENLRDLWWVRRLTAIVLVVVFVLAALVPFVITAPSRLLLYGLIVSFAVCALSLTVLTGWAGQLSLGQMAFAGLGGLLAAALVRGLELDVGIVSFTVHPLPFVLSIVLAAFITAGIAALIGAGSLRVRGLLLAVVTFVFAVMAQQYLYRQPILSGGAASLVSFPRGTLFGISLDEQRSYYWFALAILALCLAFVSRLRKSGVGRTTIAVRDNADTAAAYTVNPTVAKIRAFAIAGGLAGLGGALIAGAVESIPYTERYFLVGDSLALVAMVVIGGIASPVGAVLGAVWVVGMPAFFPDNALVPLLTSSLGLLVLLLYFPGGFVQIAFAARDGFLSWLSARRPPADTSRVVSTPAVLRRPERALLGPDVAALEVRDLTVRFGGNVAVNDVTLRVETDEIVGLIGTNGAGKSTLMNGIGGFVHAKGTVLLGGVDVSRHGAAHRAREGLGRTFQAARLFPELTVRETVEVACEARGRTGFLSTALFLPQAGRRERQHRSDADDLIGFLGLGRYANVRIADLSTGTRRIVELADLLALDARVLCLDEPTAGVAQRETEAFGPLIKEIRRELGASMLVIEHDMPLIMGISDRVYCLEVGRVIAEGPPEVVRHDPKVVASYLGMDERAIARSGAAVTTADEP